VTEMVRAILTFIRERLAGAKDAPSSDFKDGAIEELEEVEEYIEWLLWEDGDDDDDN
jgi:hypothetical protein